jgi:AAHS family 4-hydroxybenzoate transporter-like MFS transporter
VENGIGAIAARTKSCLTGCKTHHKKVTETAFHQETKMQAEKNGKPNDVVNVTQLIDGMPFTRLQLTVVVLCALVGLLDGADTQSIGVTAPFIAEMMGMKINSFGPVFAASQLGAAIGALSFGSLADRYGRKPMLAIAITLFALFTLATVHATTLPVLIVVRFLAGIGLGGATPCFLSMTSDYSPKKQRGTIATIIWSAYPLGAALGGFMNAYIIKNYDWRTIFYVGGVLPLAIMLLLLVVMPESVQYLAARGNAGANARIRKILARMGQTFESQDVQFVVDGKKMTGVPVKHLFSDRMGMTTLMLWAVFFLAFATTNLMVMWTPALLHNNGLEHAATAVVLGFINLGAFLGMASAGRLVDRFGPVRSLGTGFFMAAIFLGILGSATTTTMAAALGFAAGMAIGIGGAGAIAVATLLYPAAIRSSGIGWGMGMGRFGQFVSPLIVGALLTAGFGTGQILLAAMAFPGLAAVFVVLLWRLEWRGGSGGSGGSARREAVTS